MDIQVSVIGQELRVMPEHIRQFAPGSKNFVRFVFDLGADWDNLTTFVQFEQDGVGYNIYLDENNAAYLPQEIHVGTCRVMLYGTHGTDTIGTTNCLAISVNDNGYVDDATSIDLTPTLYEQLASMVAGAVSNNSVLNSRMSALEAAPTVPDSEIIGVRTDVIGRTFDNAGDAVREQVNDVLDLAARKDEMWTTITQGSISLTTGEADANGTKRIRTAAREIGDGVCIRVPDGMKTICFYYDESPYEAGYLGYGPAVSGNRIIRKSDTITPKSGVTDTDASNAHYFRLMIRWDTSTQVISPTDYSEDGKMYYTMYTTVSDSIRWRTKQLPPTWVTKLISSANLVSVQSSTAIRRSRELVVESDWTAIQIRANPNAVTVFSFLTESISGDEYTNGSTPPFVPGYETRYYIRSGDTQIVRIPEGTSVISFQMYYGSTTNALPDYIAVHTVDSIANEVQKNRDALGMVPLVGYEQGHYNDSGTEVNSETKWVRTISGIFVGTGARVRIEVKDGYRVTLLAGPTRSYSTSSKPRTFTGAWDSGAVTGGVYIVPNDYLYMNVSGPGDTTTPSEARDAVQIFIDNLNTDSHDIPEGSGVNAVKRARQMLGIRYTTAAALPYHNNDDDTGTIAAGMLVNGVVYSSVWELMHFVGQNISHHTYITAANDPNSYLYTRRFIQDGKNRAAWYGTVCSAFVSQCLGLDMQLTTYQIPFAEGMTKNEDQSVYGLKIGDVLCKFGNHTEIVTDIVRDRATGDIKYVTICDSWQPYIRMRHLTPEQYISFAGTGYFAYRYDKLQRVGYTPTPWVTVDDERIKIPTYTIGDTVTVKLASDTVYTHWKLVRDHGLGAYSTGKIPSSDTITITTADTGLFELYLTMADTDDLLYTKYYVDPICSTHLCPKSGDKANWSIDTDMGTDSIRTLNGSGEWVLINTEPNIEIDILDRAGYDYWHLYKDGSFSMGGALTDGQTVISIAKSGLTPGMYSMILSSGTGSSAAEDTVDQRVYFCLLSAVQRNISAVTIDNGDGTSTKCVHVEFECSDNAVPIGIRCSLPNSTMKSKFKTMESDPETQWVLQPYTLTADDVANGYANIPVVQSGDYSVQTCFKTDYGIFALPSDHQTVQ